MQKYCHHCHRPTDHPDHAGIQTGVNKCTLSHFDGCHEGHYNDKSWTDCPAATGGEGNGSFGSGISKESKVSPNKLGDEKLNLDGAAKVDPKEFLIVDTDDEEDMHLQEEVELLRLQVQQQSQESLARLQSDEQEKKERKRLRREKLERERLELLSVAKKFQDRRPEYNPATIQPSRQNLKDKAAELAARQQWDGARQRQQVTGLTMGGIRELPGMTPAVEDWITKLQSSVPSLAKTPTGQAPTGGSFQPQGVLSQAPTASVPRTHAHVSSETIDTDLFILLSEASWFQCYMNLQLTKQGQILLTHHNSLMMKLVRHQKMKIAQYNLHKVTGWLGIEMRVGGSISFTRRSKKRCLPRSEPTSVMQLQAGGMRRQFHKQRLPGHRKLATLGRHQTAPLLITAMQAIHHSHR